MITQNRIKTVLTLAAMAMAILVLATTSANAAFVDGLVEYWELDGDYSAEVTASHVGTLQATGTGITGSGFVSGKFGQGIDLESSDDSNQASIVIGGDENDFDFAGQSMSVSAWYTTESLYTAWQALAAKGEGGNWRLHRNSNSSYGSTTIDINFVAGNVGATGDGELDQQDGSWHHVVATLDATGGPKLYIDGSLVASAAGPVTIGSNSAAMQIGGNPGAANRGWDGIIDDVGVWDRALTAGEVSLMWNGGAGASIRSLTDPMNPSPYNGETVLPANPLTLRWTSLDPNSTDPVWVDVWFGMDPEALALVVDADVDGQDANSVAVDASALGVYYWRVDSYLGGSPTSDPNIGNLWTFSTDFPPSSVEILTPDMITWSGRGVDLEGTFVDDSDPLDWTIAWSADPDAGVSFTDATALDPTVTITKVSGFVPFVVNGGFEDEVLADGGYVYSLGEPWRDGYYWGSGWYDDDYYAGVENPDTAYGGIVPEGENAAFQYSYAGYDMGLRQILTSTLVADTHYELSVMVGNPDAVASNDYRVELLAGGFVLNSTTGPSPAPDTWTAAPVTVIYDSPSSVDVGQALEIRLVLVDDGSTDQLLNFDDVTLRVDGESSTYDTAPLTVTVTFGVNDVINPAAVTDTMTIDVYDTPCRAAIAAGPLDPADFDKNCIVDLADLAIFLDEYLTCTLPNVSGCTDGL